MTEILIGSNPDDVSKATTLPQTAEEKARQLPMPKGYRMLVGIPDAEKEYGNGLVKADETLRMEEVLSTVFFVISMGPDCYKDEKRFPNGPWCQEGDFILARPNTVTRLKIHGREFRLINDVSVEAVVEDPRGITRA